MPQNSFVGRERDVEAVRTLLAQERWVTVVGAAGNGKTRLALELAAGDDRVPVVAELERASPATVPAVVAKAVGLGAESVTGLIAATGLALAAERYLLVLDNGDRVAEAVCALVEELMVLAGSLTVLITSRTPIGGSADRARSAAPTARVRDLGAVSAAVRRRRSPAARGW